jgi:uncharacterized protein YbjT (DUF2867 family)
MDKILITGATGNVGFATLRLLVKGYASQFQVVAAVRDVDRARNMEVFNRVLLVKFEFDEPGTYAAALDGDVSKHIFPFLDYIENSDVKHVVFVSILGAERSRLFANHRIETHLKKMNVDYSILRPSLYMQNLITMHGQEIRQNDRIYIPAGTGTVNYIDARDVALAVVSLFANPGHEGKEYDITGAEAMDFYQIAGLFSKELGREVKYARPLTIKFIRQKMLEKKHLHFIVTLSLLYGSARNTKLGRNLDVFKELTGRYPAKLADFIHEFRHLWLK